MNAPPVPVTVMTSIEHRKRWAGAVARVWDFMDNGLGSVDRPGMHQEHVFDFHDGLRLIVSTERLPPDGIARLHVSASILAHSRLFDQVARKRMSRDGFVTLVRERVTFLSGRSATLCYWSSEGIPHLYDPAMPQLRPLVLSGIVHPT